jgi:hypothetical protein
MDQKFASKNPKRATAEEIIIEIAGQYEGDKISYIVRLLRLFHKAIADDILEQNKKIVKELKFLENISLKYKSAKALTNSEDDAIRLMNLFKQIKEMGLSNFLSLEELNRTNKSFKKL